MSGVKRRSGERRRAVPLAPEVRHWRAEAVEVRSAKDTDELIVTGRPIVFGVSYEVHDAIGVFRERIMPGAVKDVLARGADTRFMFNHDGLPLARTISGTLELSESPDALRFEATLDARQQLANDLAIAIERGDISQMSIGFYCGRDEWDKREENRIIFSIRELMDVSAVTYPASPSTSIAVAQRMLMEVPVESRARVRRMLMRTGSAVSAKDRAGLLGLVGRHEPSAPVRSSGSAGETLRRELASRERIPALGGATRPPRRAEDLRRQLSELQRQGRTVRR